MSRAEVRFRHAADRAPVILPDGRLGRVLYIGRDSGRAKVRVEGRHVQVPVGDLRLATIHLVEKGTGRVLCCDLDPTGLDGTDRDRVTTDPAGLTCGGLRDAPRSPGEGRGGFGPGSVGPVR